MSATEALRAATAKCGSDPRTVERLGGALDDYSDTELARRPYAPVLIGEKAADAAALIFPYSVCVTSSGGSQVAAKADWTQLATRLVTISPDHDEPGLKDVVVYASLESLLTTEGEAAS